MEFLLPDERTMELMRREFDSLDIGGRAKMAPGAIAACMTDTYKNGNDDEAQNSLRLHKNDVSDPETPPSREGDADGDGLSDGEDGFDGDGARCARERQKARAAELLYLYFIKVLGYNSRYGTKIYDAQRGLGGLQPIDCAFRKLNGLD